MLYDFIQQHRSWLLDHARKLREARGQVALDPKMEQGFSLFLDQLVDSLKIEQERGMYSSSAISGPASGVPSQSAIGSTASVQGAQMYDLGISLDDMVHSYGDLCHSIVGLAEAHDLRMEVAEYRLLNHCLDSAIANAVSEYSFRHDSAATIASERDEHRRLTALSEQFRKHLGTATTAIAALKARELTLGGITGTILERSLLNLDAILNELPSEAAAARPSPALLDLFSLATFLEQIAATMGPCAVALSQHLTLAPVDHSLALAGSPDMLQAAVICLLQACLDQSHPGDEITLQGYRRGKYIMIDILCPSHWLGTDDEAAALLVARRLLADNSGQLQVRDHAGEPLTFSLRLPRHHLPT
ncbi:hypothetical protein H3H37_05910 [Duganella sp. LX20W]|uniref:Uncharacterized protein n=1 Tax=Rugamonas brunnea TaxID=2758569 RepID=A0A7W2EQ44_9BURK|nr:hypothetical protein [Rugamonas brunnea]MBA5636586.1 hypothetical protein [Rugamonas brunnea]